MPECTQLLSVETRAETQIHPLYHHVSQKEIIEILK